MSATLDQDKVFAAASPAGFGYVASRNEPEPYRPARFHTLIADAVNEVTSGKIDVLMLQVPVQHGKLLADDTQIPTPEGWKRHGDLKPGDRVFGADGKPIVVTAVLPPGETEYVVRFDDGSEIHAHGAHEWVVTHAHKRIRTYETCHLARLKLWSGHRGLRHSTKLLYHVRRPALDLRNADLPPKAARNIGIVAVERAEPKPGRCISVSAPDGLYLAGESMLPTHNSTTAAVLGSAQFLGTHPSKYVVAVSYSTDYAADNIGSKARGWLERHGSAYFNVTVDPRSAARHRWNVTPGGGGLITGGIDKPPTGRRSDLLIVDDPYPGIKDAMNKRFRDDVWLKYQFELASRLAPGAGEVHIMSRWGDDDHLARLQKHVVERGARWKLIDFPALAICSECAKSDRLEYGVDGINACGHGVRDELGRLPGEALWPEVRDRAFLLGRRKAVGSRAYDALYQGRPRPDGGLMFGREWFQYAQIHDGRLILRPVFGKGVVHAVPIAACRRFQFVDPATSTEADAARFRIGTFLLTPQLELVIIDMVGGTLGAPRAKALMRQQYAYHNPQVIGVEKNGLGLVFVQDLIAESMPIRPIAADKDKVSRASVATILYENARVYHLAGAPWLAELEEELVSFPGGAYKDQVDVISMAAIATSQASGSGPAQGLRID